VYGAMKSTSLFDDIKNSQSYTEWPELNRDLLRRVHGELRQNLSSLLNGSPYLTPEAFTPLEIAPRPPTDKGTEDDDLEFEDLAVFYLSIRPQVTLSPNIGGTNEQVEKKSGPRDYAQVLSLPAVFFRKADFDVASVLVGEDALNPFLLAKLSFFLDTIELELVKLTSKNSDSFFTALSEITALHLLVQRATAMIRSSRGALVRLEESLIRSALVVPQLQRRAANAASALSMLAKVGHIMAAATRVDELLADGHFADALELSGETVRAMAPLRGVAALRDMPSLLESKMDHMKRDMEQRLIDIVASADFNRTEMERVCLPLFQGFVRAKRLAQLWQVLHKRHLLCISDALSVVVSNTRQRSGYSKKSGSSSDLSRPPPPVYRPVATTLISPRGTQIEVNPMYEVDDDERVMMSRSAGGVDSGTSSTADSVEAFFQSLRHEELLALIGNFVNVCTLQVEKFVFLAELCLMVLPAQQGSTKTAPPEIQEVLEALCEFVHGQIVHVLEFKSVDNAKLTLPQFSQLYATCNSFVLATESLTGRKSCHVLRGCLMTQAKGFLSAFHAGQLRQLASSLEAERWSGVDVPGEYQVMVDRICDQKESVQTKLGLWEMAGVCVGASQYRVVGAVLQAIRCISDYLDCLQKLPLLAVDMTLLLKVLLGTFNSRAASLVLGAQAIHGVAHLKSISTKNLAVCYESVGLMLALFAPLRKVLCLYLSERQQVLLDDYTVLAKEYEEHRLKLFAMLVSVMRQTVMGYVARLRSSEWGAFPERVSDYVTGITEKTQTMHRLLLAIFCTEDLQKLMDEILVM
jgi:vacuolar protein sorting-associated protein 54